MFLDLRLVCCLRHGRIGFIFLLLGVVRVFYLLGKVPLVLLRDCFEVVAVPEFFSTL